ncbi:MAG: hypothetical protein ACI4BA_09680 [Prevotella sp.]
MENSIYDAPVKGHSIAGIIKHGFRLMFHNKHILIKHSLLTSMLFAVIFMLLTITCSLAMSHLSALLYAIVAAGILFILGGLVETGFYANHVEMLSLHLQQGSMQMPRLRFLHFNKKAYWRTFKGILFVLVLTLIPCVLFAAFAYWRDLFTVGFDNSLPHIATHFSEHPVSSFLSVLIWGILQLLLVPLYFILMKYLLEPDMSLWKCIAGSLKIATEKYGKIFSVILIGSLILLCINIIVLLPYAIIWIAKIEYLQGCWISDPVTFPGYIGWLHPLLALICGWCLLVSRLIFLYIGYYLYGSIEHSRQQQIA